MNFKNNLKSICTILFLFICTILFSISASAVQAEGKNKETKKKEKKEVLTIDQKIDAIFKDYQSMDSPGVAVAVILDGMVVYRKGFGSAQLEYNIPITPSTVFHIASISKQFTAMAITMLEAEGKLSVQDDIRKHLPEVPDFGKKIRIGHLLNHTSGLRDQWDLFILSGWSMSDVLTQEQIMEFVKRQKDLNFTPGDRLVYCNTGFTLLAEIVSRVGGKPFEQWTMDHIFKPLGMNSTHFHKDNNMIVKNRAYSYDKDDKKGLQKNPLNYANVGATSLFTTVEDMANWMRNFEEKRVGGAKVIEKLITTGKLNNGKPVTYARGIGVNQRDGMKYITHSGGDAGFRSNMIYYPDHKFGIVVLSNYGSARTSALCRQITGLYKDQLLKKQPPKMVPAESQKNAKEENALKKSNSFAMSTKKLKTFAGTFWLKSLSLLREMVVEKGQLYYSRSKSNRSKLLADSPNSFHMENAPTAKLVFSDLKNGHYQSLVLDIRDGEPIKGKRLKSAKIEAGNLPDYVGRYYSEELDINYYIFIKDKKLMLRFRGVPGDAFTVLPEGHFTNFGGYCKFEFQRDAQQKVTGFKVSTRRSQNIKFKKIN